MAGGSTFGFNSNPLPTRGPRNTILHSNIFEYQVPGTGTRYLVNKNEAPASPNPTTCPRNGRQQNLIGCARGSTLASTPQPLQQQNRVSRASLPPSHPQRTCHMRNKGRGRRRYCWNIRPTYRYHTHKKKCGAHAPYTYKLTPGRASPVETRVSRLHSDGVRGCHPPPTRHPSAAPVLRRRGVQGEPQNIGTHQQS